MNESAAEDGPAPEPGLVRVVVPTDHCTQAAYRKAVSQRLRMARVVLDISQQDVADAAGCSRNFVSAVERGVQGMDAYRLSLIATALRMPPRTLMEGDGWDHWVDSTRYGTPHDPIQPSVR
jgi:DNA-binding XRE family transcriptional regulator